MSCNSFSYWLHFAVFTRGHVLDSVSWVPIWTSRDRDGKTCLSSAAQWEFYYFSWRFCRDHQLALAFPKRRTGTMNGSKNERPGDCFFRVRRECLFLTVVSTAHAAVSIQFSFSSLISMLWSQRLGFLPILLQLNAAWMVIALCQGYFSRIRQAFPFHFFVGLLGRFSILKLIYF